MTKWYQALTRSGQPCGLRMHCDTCGLCIPHDAPAVIRHCGSDEKAPRDTKDLPTYRLGVRNGLQNLPANMVLLGWEEDEPIEPLPRMEWL